MSALLRAMLLASTLASFAVAATTTILPTSSSAAYPSPSANAAHGSTGCGQSLPDGITTGKTATVNVTFDGVARAYNIYVPSSYSKNKAAPLILAYHGRDMEVSDFEAACNLTNEDWNPYGIVMFPYGINEEWEGDPDTIDDPPDDQGFTMSLIDAVEKDYCIDTSRIWATGMSNGGGLSNLMACNSTMNSRISVFGMHSGAFYTTISEDDCDPTTVDTSELISETCDPGKSVPLIELHGTADDTIPYEGGGRRGYCLPAIQSQWLGQWATRDDQLGSAITQGYGSGATLYAYGNGSTFHVSIANWGHVWASIEAGARFDATPLMMQFFYDWSAASSSDTSSSTTTAGTATATTSSAAAATTTMHSGAKRRVSPPRFW